MIIKYYISILFTFLFWVSCAGIPPIQEYTLARTALVAAKKFEANKYNPKSYRKAVYFYKKAKVSFDQRLYELSREYFNQCLEFAEKSEDLTRWTKYKEGDFNL